MQFNVDPNFDARHGNDQRKVIILETCSGLRERGRRALSGHWPSASLVTFLYVLLTDLPASLIDRMFGKTIVVDLGQYLKMQEGMENLKVMVRQSPMSGVYKMLTAGAFLFGITLYFMDLYRKKRSDILLLFKGFEFYVRSTGLFFYVLIFTVFWCMIPIVGVVTGPIAMIRYSMSYYVMLDHPEYPIPMCVNESKRLMAGNKMKYFTMRLSFVGWILVAILPAAIIASFFATAIRVGTVGMAPTIISLVAMICLYPVMAYIESTSMAFYEILIGNEQAEVYYPQDRG